MTPELAALVERVTRENSRVCCDGCECEGQIEGCNPDYCSCRKAALAAIRCIAEATREPTDQMEHAYLRSYIESHEVTPRLTRMDGLRAAHAASVLGEALRHGE